jgi:TRAP-type C4-dicarboxylate transport system permease large subunit
MFLPVIQTMGDAAGIHPVHLGVVVVLTSALGLVTPPYGVCLLVASQIADVPVRQTILMTLVVGSVGVVVILLAIFIPDLTLFLPRTLMPQYF